MPLEGRQLRGKRGQTRGRYETTPTELIILAEMVMLFTNHCAGCVGYTDSRLPQSKTYIGIVIWRTRLPEPMRASHSH